LGTGSTAQPATDTRARVERFESAKR